MTGFADVSYAVSKSLTGTAVSTTVQMTASRTGNYKLGVFAKAAITEPEQGKEAAEIPVGYRFEISVKVDGVAVGTLTIDPALLKFAYGYIYADLGKGAYNVSFEWVNPLEGVELLIDKVKLGASANMNGNDSVDLQDVSLLSRMIDSEISSAS